MLVDTNTKLIVLSRVVQELTKDKPPNQVMMMIQNIHNKTVQEIYQKTTAYPKCHITVIEQ